MRFLLIKKIIGKGKRTNERKVSKSYVGVWVSSEINKNKI
jgi:hypothetical protein